MREQSYDGLSLFGRSGNRKYLNAAERRRFFKATRRAEPKTRLFCPMLGWSGILSVAQRFNVALYFSPGIARKEVHGKRPVVGDLVDAVR